MKRLHVTRYTLHVKSLSMLNAYCLLLTLLLAGSALAQTAATTGRASASAVVCTTGCRLMWVNVEADGTNAVTATIYAGQDATGKQIDKIYLPAGYYGVKKDYWSTNMPGGIYISLSGTNGFFSVGYNDQYNR